MSWHGADPSDESTEILSSRIVDLEYSINTQLTELRTDVGLVAAAVRSTGGGVGAESPLSDLEAQLAHAVTVSLSAALEAINESLTAAITAAVAELGSKLEAVVATNPPEQWHSAEAPPALWSAADLDEVAASLQQTVQRTLQDAPRPQWPAADFDEVAASLQQSVQRALQDAPRPQWPAADFDEVAASLQQSVQQALQEAPRPQVTAADLDEVAASLQQSVLLALNSFEPSTVEPSTPLDPSNPPATARDLASVNERIDEFQSLTEEIAKGIAELRSRLEAISSRPPPQPAPIQVPRPQLDPVELDNVATSLQHSVLQALNSFEESNLGQPGIDPSNPPATARDVARVNQRIDELRSLLLG